MASFSKRGDGPGAARIRRPDRLTSLLADATACRRLRLVDLGRTNGGEREGVASLSAAIADGVLTGRLPAVTDVGALLTRLATLQQLSRPHVAESMTSAATVRMSGRRARALAVAVDGLVGCAADCVDAGAEVSLYLVVVVEGDRLVVGLAVTGGYSLVPSASASRALLRSRAIVEALGGEFQRGVDGDRMAFGVSLPLRGTGPADRGPF